MTAPFVRSEEYEDDEQAQRQRELGTLGHIASLSDEPGTSTRKRRIGFVTEDDRVLKSGIVKSRRSPKRAKKE